MTSKEIITNLIDQRLISGEEAYILINDIVQAEIVATMKLMDNSKDNNQNIWTVTANPPSWYNNTYTTTCESGSATYSVSSV